MGIHAAAVELIESQPAGFGLTLCMRAFRELQFMYRLQKEIWDEGGGVKVFFAGSPASPRY